MQKYIEERPWGEFIRFTDNEPSTVKILTVKAGEAFSLQYHAKRTEYWYILEGTGLATVGERRIKFAPGEEFLIEPLVKHRIESELTVRILEISFGEFDEKDVVRLEDKYGRLEKQKAANSAS